MGGARIKQLGPRNSLAPIVEAAVICSQVPSARLPFQYVPHYHRLPHISAFREHHSIANANINSCNRRSNLHTYGARHWFKEQAWRGAPSFSCPSRVQLPKHVCCFNAKESDSEGREDEPGHLFCFGFGYTTLGLANTLKKEGWKVTGTCRSEEKKEALIAKGLPAVIFDTDGDIDGLESDGLAALRSATHLIASIPPVGDFDQDPALALHAQQIREAARNGLSWIGYLSTTGVYGDWDGAWVDESTEPRPSNARAAARLRAEEAWLSVGREANVPVHVFRLGGIYGPSRSAIDVVRSGRPASQTQRVRESRRFTSRCHVADIVQVVTLAMKHPTDGGQIYNVVDDNPATRREVVAYARELLERPEAVERGRKSSTEAAGVGSDETGQERPSRSGEVAEISRQAGTRLVHEKGSAEANTEALEHDRPAVDQEAEREESAGRLAAKEERRKGVDEKRVRNDRIKRELGVTLLFPSYKEGLAAIADGDIQPFSEHVGV